MDPQIGRVGFAWPKAVWLYGMLTPALVFGAVSVEAVALGTVLTVITVCLGHSVGLHRGVIHRAYRAPKWFRNVQLELFALTGLGGPLSWIRLHYVRDYWQNQSTCPPYFGYRHSIFRDFIWNLHGEFVPKDPGRYGVPAELESDPWIRFLEQTWPMHSLALALAIAWIDPSLAATAVCGRVAVTILGHWFVGFISHKYGYQPYTIEGASEEGRNTLVLGWLSFGEGFHNNHHAFPRSARMGHRWFELDLGWLAIRSLRFLGLATDVLETSGTRRTRA